MEHRCCFFCNFYVPEDKSAEEEITQDDDSGYCHRKPPVLGYLIKGAEDDLRAFGAFPRVTADDWCGEFKPREVPHE